MEKKDKSYQKLTDKYAPPSPKLKNSILAFLYGGAICTVGQAVMDIISRYADKEAAGNWTSIIMVFLGALLTGLGFYEKMAKYAGAGTLVPITGFANSIASPAIEFKSEGLVLGMGAKMFVIAGPVLVYGISASVICGIILQILSFFGIKPL